MKTRQAAPADLPRLNEMHWALARQMARQGLAIWDEVYPCVCLPGDIRAGRLFVLEEGGAPKAAFALCRDDAATAAMALASGQGAQYLRLFVVESNAPALAFYRKNGFSEVSGCREEDVGTGVLRELGFEVCLAQAARAR